MNVAVTGRKRHNGARRRDSSTKNRIPTTESVIVANFAVILAAAGKSSRFKDKNYKKPFAPLSGRPVWLHSAERFLARDDVKQLLFVISPEGRVYFQFQFSPNAAIPRPAL